MRTLRRRCWPTVKRSDPLGYAVPALPGRQVKLAFAVLVATAAVATAATPASAGLLYTNNYNAKQIAALTIQPTGYLAAIFGSPFAVPHFPDGIAITPNGQLMVVGSAFDQYIELQSLAADGTPSPVGSPISAPVGGAPAITPDGRFAYLPRQPIGLLAFAVSSTGLTQLGGFAGSGVNGLPAVTPDGRFLLAPGYTTKAIERFAIGADGVLSALGSTPVGVEGPRAIRVTPDGRFAVLLSQPGGNDALQAFAIGADGSLTATGPAIETVGAVTGLPVVSPDGRFVYVPNGNEGSVSTYAISPAGVLSPVGGPVATGLSQPEALAMSPDGRFLYVEPQSGLLIQPFAVAADGTPSKLGSTASTGGGSDGETPTARPSAPVAAFSSKPGAPHTATSFDASGSTDAGSKIVAYNWTFGDGTTETTSAPTASHNYKEAGIYTVRLSVSDENGCSGSSFTGQTAYCDGREATGTVDTPPVIYGITATPQRFYAKRPPASKHGKPKLGTTFHYRLSEDATVTFSFQRKLKGRKVGGKCKPLTSANAKKKPCTRLGKSFPAFSSRGKAGQNARRFSGKTPHGPLKAGGYKVTAVAEDAAGGLSVPISTGITVK
jgi:hypothetical protein